MIVSGYRLFEEDQTEDEVARLSERVAKWLKRRRKWAVLGPMLEIYKERHADPSRTSSQVLRYAWNDLLRDRVSAEDRKALAADLAETDAKVQKAGGQQAYEDQLAASRGLSATRAAKKDELYEQAGHSLDVRACVQWAMRWEPRVRSKGRNDKPVLRWELVAEPPPGPAALSYLERAIADPESFYSQIVPKFMGKADEEDGVRRYEERAIEGILAMLHEVEREIAEKGEEAYA